MSRWATACRTPSGGGSASPAGSRGSSSACKPCTRSPAFRIGNRRRSGSAIGWRAASTTALSIPTPARSPSASIFGCDFHGSSPMRLRRLLPSLLASATLLGCANLDLTDPNEPSTDTFWRTAADAVAGGDAVYNGLQTSGTYGRSLVVARDLRPAVGLLHSPGAELRT